VTNRNNGSYEASAVGEVNVVDLMKKEQHYRRGGNGGIIYQVALWSI
jgi:phosphomannomutase